MKTQKSDLKITKLKKKQEKFNNQFYVIQNMWDYLGVSIEYKNLFISVAKELDPEIEKEFFDFEVGNLKKLNTILGVIILLITYKQKLGKEIQARENSINLIKKFLQVTTAENISDKLLTEILNNLKNLRMISLNVVHYFKQFNDIISHGVLVGKFKPEKINKIYSFDPNYLSKVKLIKFIIQL